MENGFDGFAEVGAIAAGSAGAGAEGIFEIAYTAQPEKNTLRGQCHGGSRLGGKAGCAYELGVDEGIELLAHLHNYIDFHRMDSVAQAAFEVYLNVAFMQFVAAGKLAGKLGEGISSWLAGRKVTDRELKQTKQTIYTNLNDNKKLQNSPPEALGELLQTITEFPEEEDFNAILRVLQSAEGRNDNAHKLKWIVRSFHDPELSRRGNVTDAMKKSALEEGIAELLGFGESLDEMQRNQYVNQMQVTLQRNGVTYAQ
jgi:hypothetical protein